MSYTVVFTPATGDPVTTNAIDRQDAKELWLLRIRLAESMPGEVSSVAIHYCGTALSGWIWKPLAFSVPDGWRPDMSPREMLPEDQA